MKSMLNVVAMIVLFSITGVASAIAASPKTVVVTNNTNYNMTQFYASSSNASGWDTTNNLFAGQTLAPGQQTTIQVGVHGDGQGCAFDLMAVLYGAAQAAYTYSVDACDGSGSWTISSGM